MLLYNYVLLVSDGSSMRAALGDSAPSMEALRSAVSNPLLDSNVQLNNLLKSKTIDVSTLASNPFQVCAEGPHLPVFYTAIAFTVVFTVGFPALGMASLWRVGKLKGLRRLPSRLLSCCCCRSRSSSSSRSRSTGPPLSSSERGGPPPPTRGDGGSFLHHIHTALKDDSLRREMAWYTYWEMLLLAVITGLVGASRRTRTGFGFALTQGGIIGTALCAVLVLCAGPQPFENSNAWTRFPRAALHGLTALTALMSTLLVLRVGESDGKVQITLGLLPLVYALFLAIVIFAAWWLKTFSTGLPSVSQRPYGSPDGRTVRVKSWAEPPGREHRPPHPRVKVAPQLWMEKVEEEEQEDVVGDKKLMFWFLVKAEGQEGEEPNEDEDYWHCPATGESLKELPMEPGIRTACGWECYTDAAGNCDWRRLLPGLVWDISLLGKKINDDDDDDPGLPPGWVERINPLTRASVFVHLESGIGSFSRPASSKKRRG